MRVPLTADTNQPPPPARSPEVARTVASSAPTGTDGSAHVGCTSAWLASTARTQLPTPNGAPLPLAHDQTLYVAASAVGTVISGVAAKTEVVRAAASGMCRALDNPRRLLRVDPKTWHRQLRGRLALNMTASFPTFSTPAEINVVDRLWRLGCPAPADPKQVLNCVVANAAAVDLGRAGLETSAFGAVSIAAARRPKGKLASQRHVASDRDMTPRDWDRASLALNSRAAATR